MIIHECITNVLQSRRSYAAAAAELARALFFLSSSRQAGTQENMKI